MIAFHEVQFPTDISYGSQGGPEWTTEVIVLGTGYEQRNQLWTYPRERWDVAYGVKERDDLVMLLDFFMARKGRLHGFRFKNHNDYTTGTTQQPIGMGDNNKTTFQLIKRYSSGSYNTDRKIVKPIETTVEVYVNGQAISNWSVDDTTGIVTIIPAPSAGSPVTATFEFDVPMRFDADFLPVSLATYEAGSAAAPLVELKL